MLKEQLGYTMDKTEPSIVSSNFNKSENMDLRNQNKARQSESTVLCQMTDSAFKSRHQDSTEQAGDDTLIHSYEQAVYHTEAPEEKEEVCTQELAGSHEDSA